MLFRFGVFELDEEAGELRDRGLPVAIQPKPFELLRILLRERERVVSSEELFERLWPGVAVTPSSLTRAVSVARRAIGDTHRGEVLRSVARRGYRFAGDALAIDGRVTRPRVADATEDLAAAALIGREADFARLRAAWAEAGAGRGGVALLSGPPGIGKTSLAEAFAAAAGREGAQVLVGRGREGEGVPPLWVWVQVLRGLLARDREGAARRALEGAAAELADLLPELAPAAAPRALAARPEEARFLLFDAVARALGAAASRGPLLLVVEDLQWAGAASLRLFEHVALELEGLPLLLVGTLREGAVEAEVERTLARVRRQLRTAEIPLARLSRAEVAALLERKIGAAPPADLTSELYARTEGVPLYLHEAIRLLDERGALRRPEGVRRWAVTLPGHVLELIRRPLDRLSADAGALLDAGAVLGREFALGQAAAVAGIERGRALDLADEAERAGVIEASPDEPGVWRFGHALHQEALYAGLPAGRRTRLHARAAALLESQHGGDSDEAIAERAHHQHQALAVGDPEQAFACAVRAAARATRLRDFEQAAMHRQQAVAALEYAPGPGGARRLDALLALGEAHSLAGDRRRRVEAFGRALESARGLGDREAFARAAVGLCDLTEWSPRRDEATRAVIEEALAALGPEAKALRVALLTRLAYLDVRTARERAEPVAREAVAQARALGDPDLKVDALYVLHFLIAAPDAFAEREALTDEMRAVAPEAERPEEAVVALVDVASDCIAQGDAEGARRRRAEAGALAAERPHPGNTWHLLAYDTGLAHLEGRFSEVERLAREALGVGLRIDHPYAVGVFVSHRVGLARDRGDHAEVFRRFGGRAMESAPFDWMKLVAARAAFALGREAEARRQLEAAAPDGFARLPRNIRWLATITELAHLCADLGDAARAAELEEVLRVESRLHGVLPVPICYGGPVARALARLVALQGRTDEALALYDEALASARALGARPMQARILAEEGALLARRGSRAAARERLGEGAKLAASLGMEGVTEAAEAELGRLGAAGAR